VRLIAFLEYAAVLIGVVAMIAGHFFALPKAFHLGVFLVGAGMLLGGIEAIFTRRMAFRPAEDAYENYAGAPALIVGLMALVIGAGAIASAYLLDMAQWHATVHYLMRRPAPLLAVGGLFFIGIGILMLLNPQGHHTWAWRILVYVPRSAGGVIVIAAGVAGMVLGAWEWQNPKAFEAFAADLPRKIRLLY
jgi:uncharacterized membrane protein YidH (DUF202 family)